MRKTQNHFSQLLYGLLSLILICISFGSCEAEKEVITNSRKNNNEISFEQFKKETGLFNFKKTINITNNIDATTARTTNGDYELSDFNISTDIIKKLDANNIKSYTFRIVPKDSVVSESKSIFNLSLIKKDDIWKTTIIEFRPTDLNYDQIKQGLTEKVEGQAKIWYHGDLNNFASETPVAMKTLIMIEHCIGGGDCNPSTGYCDRCSQCVTITHGGSFGPPNSGPPTSISGGNVAGGGGSYSGPGVPGPFEPIVYEPIDWFSLMGDPQTTEPIQNDNLIIANVRDVDVNAENENPITDKTPCEQLQSFATMDANNRKIPNLKSKIDDIKDFASNSVPHEAIYNFMKDNNGNYATTNFVISESTDSAEPKFSGYFYGSIHSHWYDLYPMFSWMDVYTLKRHYELASANNKSEAIVMMAGKDCLTCSHVSLYALKIDDFNAFLTKINADMINPDDPTNADINEQKKYADRQFKEKFNLSMTNQDLEKLFLEHFNNSGISIYKANDELTNWDKLSLSGNPISPISNTPCN